MLILDPPVPVAGHPVELLELQPGEDKGGIVAYRWRVKLRIIVPDKGAIEAYVRYAEDRRIMLEAYPPDPEATRLLLVSRGRGDHSLACSNPLAETIERVLRDVHPPPDAAA